ncbi:site-specific integrase [Glaciihabitans sp. dw_435]|uniref:site-specific integrase n=1 Tax=Glaciihabitans sp. dw_435 TaxID=2720081 RepID=UPI001BD66F38|nr:site-specific integrase [Glaciihabitans sp. dw_435]
MQEIADIERTRKGAIAIPVDEVAELLKRVRADHRLQELDQVAVIEFLAATGCRLGEALGVSWDAIDFSERKVTFRTNVVRAHGQGILLQHRMKTEAGARTISVPSSLIAMLELLRATFKIHNEHDLVFPTFRGNIRDPRNTSRDWRDARNRLGYPTVTTHSVRKTVATALDIAGLSARDIAEYLGQANPSITPDVYRSRTAGGTRAADALGKVLDRDFNVRG